MSLLVTFFRWQISLFIAALAALIVYQLLTGRISMAGLLFTDAARRHFSPGRVQLLVLTIAGAFGYLLLVARNPQVMPAVPTELLAIVGASNVGYLGAKSWPGLAQALRSLFIPPDDNQETRK